MTSPNWLCRVSGLLVLGILVAASTPVLRKNGSALAQEETPATILPGRQIMVANYTVWESKAGLRPHGFVVEFRVPLDMKLLFSDH